jgi:hypothetical protein
MMRKRVPSSVLVAALLLIAGLLLGGCQALSTKSDPVVSDWSRGENAGQSALNDTLAMVVDANQHVYLCWVAQPANDQAYRLHLVHLDAAGVTLLDRDLDLAVNSASAVSLAVDELGSLHLAWIDRQEGTRSLHYAQIDRDGDLLMAPREISLAGVPVRSYDMAAIGEALELVWSSSEGAQPGLYHTRIALDGQTILESQRLRDRGYDPSMRWDGAGALLLAWQEVPSFGQREVYYAELAPTRDTLDNVQRLAAFPAPSGVLSRPPCLALAEQRVYVFWSLERRGGGLTPPAADSFYVTFPAGQPQNAGETLQVQVPPVKEPLYTNMPTAYHVSQLAEATTDGFPATFVYLPSAASAVGSDLAVAFAVQLEGRTTQILQIVLTVWRDGAMQGYQVIGRTRSSSLKPVLVADANDDLLVSWIDTAGFGRYDAFFASTSPAARARLNRLTLTDVGLRIMDALWGVVQAMSFLPLVIMWALAPLIVLAIYTFIHPEATFDYLLNRVMLLIGMAIYTLFKYALRSGWLLELPLPRGLPLGMANIMLLTAPIIISGLAGLITWLVLHRRETSLLPAFGIFVALDAAVTLLIYIPSVLAD